MWPILQCCIEFWRAKYNDPGRRPIEGELRVQPYMAFTRGASGIIWYMYNSDVQYDRNHSNDTIGTAGLLDSLRQPYAPGGNDRDSAYWFVQQINRDLRDVGPFFGYKEMNAGAPYNWTDWDTTITVRENAPNRWPCRYINDVENDGGDYSQLGFFKEHWHDPAAQSSPPESLRDYFCLVNRHCLPGDSVKYTVYVEKDSFPRKTPSPWWVVDMRQYKYSSLQKDTTKPDWVIDHNGWTHYQEPRDWGALPAVKPGEGKLFAIVGDNYLWNILGRITYYSVAKYDTNIHLEIKSWARGELFKNGPRRRDVWFVKYKVYRINIDNTIKDSCIINRYTSPDQFKWPDDDFIGATSDLDSCYVDEWNLQLSPLPPYLKKYEIHIEVYNRLGEYMGCPIFCINGKPTASSKFSKMTAYTCQKKNPDPEGVFHMVYTGGTNTPVVLYAKFNPKDTVQAVPESLYTGTYPTPESLGIGKFPTIVVKHGNPKDTLVVAWLSQYADTIYCRVKTDSVWFGPYPLDWDLTANFFSAPRMALGLRDTVYYTYTKKDQTKLKLICGKFPSFNPANQISSTVSEGIPPGGTSGPIDSLGAAIGVDYNGCPHLAWLENDTIVRYGMARLGGFAVITLAKVRYRGGLGEPVCINPPNANVCVVWPQNNKLIRSCFYVEDTVEIFRDTVRVGDDTIKQISVKDGFASWKENDHLFVGLWDAINRTWSAPETLDTDSLEGFYTQTEANQFINNANDISPARYVIWTAKVNDTLYRLTGSIKKYAGNGEYGIMPAAYLKLGQPQSTPFTVYRDSILSFGNEDYKHVDIGYDSLAYHLPSVKPDDKGRIFIESYFDSGDTTGSCLFRFVVNGRIIKDSIAIYSRQLSRTTEFLPPEVMQAGQLTIKLIKLGGDYVPCSRIILTTFERD